MVAVPVVAGVHAHQLPLSRLNGPGSPGSVSEQTVKSKSLIGPLPEKTSGKAKSLLLTVLVAASSTLIRLRVTPFRVTFVPVASRPAATGAWDCGMPLPSTHSRSSAKAPTTCGVAIEVPLLMPWLLPVGTAASTLTPGAHQRRPELELVNEAGTSEASVAPIAIALGAQPGKLICVAEPSLPAATSTATPAACS